MLESACLLPWQLSMSESAHASCGWMEASDKEIIPFIQSHVEKGVSYVISTDIAKDGMLQGPSFELYKQILSEMPKLKLIASGGISTYEELPRLKEIGCYGTIIGKAIYEDRITLKQLENFIISNN